MNPTSPVSNRIIQFVSPVWLLAVLSSFALFLAGCETTEPAATPKAVEAPTVTKGMSAEEVVSILGEPLTVDVIEQDGVSAEVWLYEKEVVLSSTIESDGEQERVYNDHATGKLVTVREPIWRNETVKGKLTAEILMVEGKVAALKEKKEAADYGVSH